jgi:hypothetical protein
MYYTLRKSLLLGFILLSATWGMARQASANQEATSPKETKTETPPTLLKVRHLVNPAYPL